ncbi:MAG TPA: glycosyltransferase family 4 protein [Candidatus Limnocylindrales bacterium]|nr:glycosyltransferase family 4 protein [Candidatus Limnocylindrales bacterium]
MHRTPDPQAPSAASHRAFARPGSESAIVRTAFVSTYPPRRCGIATFTSDLRRAVGGGSVVALDGTVDVQAYGPEVQHRIAVGVDAPPAWGRTASRVSRSVDVVSVQHEYGIWGEDDGAGVLDFVDGLGVPAVATLHTVLRTPTPRQRRILTDLVRAASATVVMSRAAAGLLTSAYGIDPSRVDVIPHGVPDLPMVSADSVKPTVGLEGRRVLLSFGLLGPGKGYELAIEALPGVVARHPDAVYVIVGATHPDLVRREGERYRQGLAARAEALGVSAHVRFVDRFVGRSELTRWLESADVFVTPYPNLDQIVSGTLSYAMGAGRAIVSTPYAYAAELLADGRGLLVAPGSPTALAGALADLLADDDARGRMGRRAYAHSRRMVWDEVGAAYRAVFDRVAGYPRVLPATVGAVAAGV